MKAEPPATRNPFNKIANIKHTSLAEEAQQAGRGYLYRNEVEGGISVGVPKRAGYLSTQREMVEAVKAQGKQVHPLIEWAIKHHPEHTGEEYPKRQIGTPGWIPGQGWAQPGLAESLPTHEGYEFQSKAFPETKKTEERDYVTEGGKTMKVRRYRQQGPGTALLSPQWETDWSRM